MVIERRVIPRLRSQKTLRDRYFVSGHSTTAGGGKADTPPTDMSHSTGEDQKIRENRIRFFTQSRTETSLDTATV
jgi:hypothetical protein